MKLVFIVIILFTLNFSGIGQTIQVIDRSSLQPIENVAVIGKTYSATTNQEGKIDLTKFTMDESLEFKHLSYQPFFTSKKEIIAKNNSIMLTENAIRLNEMVFSANKSEEDKADIPQKIEVVGSKEIEFNNPQTSGDLLQQTGNVFVQQSQMGGSSPVIRGFEANKVLLVLDGVRMNNAIYRSGHLQNVITLDPSIVDRVEIVFGTGSVIYGSDAIGGVMAFYTKNPLLSLSDKANIKANAFTRYSSANNEIAGNVNFNIGFKKWAFLTSISYKDLGDLRAGSNRNTAYGDWGKCLYYSQRFDDHDSMVANDNPDIQKRSGYSQIDLMEKVLFHPNENSKYILNLQFSNSSNVPRYDRLAEMNGSELKYADWYYGPQTRSFASLRAEYKKKSGFYDNAFITAAFQNISEDRINRKFGKKSENHQEETVNVISINIDLMKKIGVKNEVRYGLEGIYNSIGSNAYSIDITNNQKSYNIASRYPDAGSTYSSVAAYLTHNWEISKKMIFSQGIRFSNISLNSEYSDSMMLITGFPFNKVISQNNSALNGNLGFVYMPGADWRFALMASSGFRAPNVDDVGKVNDSKPGNAIVIPNPELKPEYAYNIDLTIGKTIKKKVQLEATGFYTILTNAIVVKASVLNGLDSIMYSGSKTAVQSAINEAQAYVCGVQGNVKIQINRQISATSNITYTYGRVTDTDAPLDHIPPLFGMTSVKYETTKFKGEIYSRYNGWKHFEDYSPSGEDNLQQATPDGMPSWCTLNCRAGYQVNKYLNVQAGVENIFDKNYRNFASGFSAPGRNIIFALRGNF